MMIVTVESVKKLTKHRINTNTKMAKAGFCLAHPAILLALQNKTTLNGVEINQEDVVIAAPDVRRIERLAKRNNLTPGEYLKKHPGLAAYVKMEKWEQIRDNAPAEVVLKNYA